MFLSRMTTLPFLLLPLSPFVIFDSDYSLISCPLCNSNTLWNILKVLGRNVEQDNTMCCIQEWQLCLSYFWHYLPISLCYIWQWLCFALCKLNTLQNILMILRRNAEHDKTTHHIQEWQLWLSFFWSYLPYFCFWNWFCVRSVTQIPFRLFCWYLVEM